ncbi:MAG: hypothetical protein AAFQ57_13660, partial [Cyanobacteria bacterium J06626_14]
VIAAQTNETELESAPSASSPSTAPPPPSESAPTGIFGKIKAATVWVLQRIAQSADWTLIQLKTQPTSDTPSIDDQPAEGPVSLSAAEKIEGLIAQILKTVVIAIATALSFITSTGLKLLGADPQPAPADSSSQSSLIGGIGSTIWGIVWPILKQLWRLWRRLLAILRERLLPDAIKPLSDVTLTIVAVGIIYGISWVTSAISLSPSAPPVISSQPATIETNRQPVKAPSANAKRITTIQKNLTEAVSSYGDDFVQTVDIDPIGDRLTAGLDWEWYRLNARQQDQIANALLIAFQDFDINNLDVVDPDGVRVARSPVIGSSMIVFERTSDKLEELDRIAAEQAAAEREAAEQAAAEQAAAEREAAERAAAEQAAAEQAAAEQAAAEQAEQEAAERAEQAAADQEARDEAQSEADEMPETNPSNESIPDEAENT